MTSAEINKQTDFEYNTSLLKDQWKNFNSSREKIRKDTIRKLNESLPEKVESLLSRDQQRLLRCPQLSDEEKSERDKIKTFISALKAGDRKCINNQNPEEPHNYDYISYAFKFPLYADLRRCKINETLNLVDLEIEYNGEIYVLPLDSEESSVVLALITMNDLNPTQMRSEEINDIIKTKRTLAKIK